MVFFFGIIHCNPYKFQLNSIKWNKLYTFLLVCSFSAPENGFESKYLKLWVSMWTISQTYKRQLLTHKQTRLCDEFVCFNAWPCQVYKRQMLNARTQVWCHTVFILFYNTHFVTSCRLSLGITVFCSTFAYTWFHFKLWNQCAPWWSHQMEIKKIILWKHEKMVQFQGTIADLLSEK